MNTCKLLLLWLLMPALVGCTTSDRLPNIREVWDFGDPGATETRFRSLEKQALALDQGVYAAEIMTQVARTLGLRGRYDEALSLLDQVDRGPYANVPVVQVRSLLERGRTLNSSGYPELAGPMFARAFELATRNNEFFLAGDAAHMAGIVSDTVGEASWLDRLRELTERQPGTEAEYWFGPMHNNLGWTYFGEGAFELALQEFTASKAAYAGQQKRYETLIADYAAARVLRAMDQCNDALVLQQQTFARIEAEFNQQDPYVAEEIALCSSALGRQDEARAAARIAYQGLADDPWFVANKPGRLEAIRILLLEN